jgi:hypothetical protein
MNDLIEIVAVEKEKYGGLMHWSRFRGGQDFSSIAHYALAQGVIPALNLHDLPILLWAKPVLVRRNHSGIRFPESV